MYSLFCHRSSWSSFCGLLIQPSCRIPEPRTPEEEMSAEPWYRIGPGDVFPEEFGTFLLSNQNVRASFNKHHADLLGPEFWNQAKSRILAGHVEDVFPYPQVQRFRNRPTRDNRQPAQRGHQDN